MARRLADRSRPLQIAFLVILVFSAAQVVWWIYDQTLLGQHEAKRLHDLLEGERAAAERLLAEGADAARVAALFPGLDVAEGSVTVADRALADLNREQLHRFRRYAWEGGFFLLVLGGCIAVIGRTLVEESRLRRRQENFIAAVTHELKSPIASLQLAAETIAFRRPEGEQLERLTERMRTDIRRLEGMVGKILDTSSLEAGRLQLRKERISLARLAHDLVEEFAERGRSHEVTMEVDIPEQLEIAADPAAARTVVRNLLENALRATAGAGGGSIRLRGRDGGRLVELEIADSGVGFEPSEATRLFEKFYRPGDELRRTSRGTGLGLFVVRRFIELERGRVTAHSEGPGKGATFTVAWPRSASGEEES